MIRSPEGLALRLRANRDEVLARVHSAARRAGRDPATVTLVAVTKSVSDAVARALAGSGLREFGESRVRAGAARKAALSDIEPRIRWHLVGHLQSNKARLAVEAFDVIHSVDSVPLAAAVDRAARSVSRIANLLIQVNVSGESVKTGFRPEALPAAIDGVAAFPSVRVTGLMTMAPMSDDPEAARPHFRRLRELLVAERARRPDLGLRELSMGMTQDFETAVEEGATMIRVGTALFRGLTPEAGEE